MLEVGSWLGGGSTQIFIEELRGIKGQLFCVDTWRGSPNVERHQELARTYDLFGTFRHNVSVGDGDAVVRPLVMDSLDAAAVLADGAFDLVFLDGDHSYTCTRADIEAWRPKLRAGGILSGHDCEARVTASNQARYAQSRDIDHIEGTGTVFAANHPGVILAVHEAFGDKAHLWAEEPPERLPGSGRATIWDIVV
ncbi:MAG TPA: class I SAM-dependent methyltransferase [Methylovirgula sp.]